MISRPRRTALVAVAAVALTWATVSAGGAEEGARKLEMGKLLPEDGICFIRVKSANALLGGISDFVDAVQPGVSAMLKAQLGTKLAVDPAAAGLAADKPAGIAVLNPKEFKNPWVIVVPIAEEQKALLDEIKNMLGAPEDAGADLLKYGLGGDDENMFLRIAAGHVVVGGSDSAVSTIADAVKKNGLGEHDADDTLVAAVNVEQVLKLYGEELKAAVKGFREAPDEGADEMGLMGPLALFAPFGKIFRQLGPDLADMGVEMLEQIEGVEVAVTVNKEKLSISETIIAKADTSLAKFIAAQKRPEAGTAELVPAGGCMAMVARLEEGAMKPHLDAAVKKILGTLAGAGDDEAKAARDEMAGWMKLIGEAFGEGHSEAATALVPSGGGLATVQAVVRPGMPLEKALKLTEDAARMASESQFLKAAMAAGGGQLTMKFERNVRENDGVKISRLTQETVGQMPEMAAVQAKMYGSPQVTEIAYLAEKKMYLTASGKEASKRMDELLDRVREGDAEGSFGRSAVYAEIRQKTPKDACAIWAVSPTGYAKLMIDSMAPMMPFQIPADDLKSLEGLAKTEKPVWGYMQSGGGAATMTFEVHAPTIGQLARFFQQLFMKMQGGGMQPGAPVPPPPPDGGIGGGVF